MKCPHRPISNGWSAGTGSQPTTWCGRCKEHVAVDEDWANAYYDRRRAHTEKDFERVLRDIEIDRSRLIEAIQRGGL